ncbi:MAG: glycosyltransferase family 4 protein [Aquihabitans sp.]
MAEPHVVILGHAADRTGPPVYLLQLLRALDRSGLRITIVLLRGGELLAELQELAEVRIVGEPVDEATARPARRAEEPGRIRARRAQLADLDDVDLALVNTAWSIHALPWLPRPPTRVVSIVHELRAGVADLLDPESLQHLLDSDGFVAGCSTVARMLTDDLGVPAARVTTIPYGVEVGELDQSATDRAALAADDGDLLVVAAAVPDRRKGPDLFVHLAAAARRLRPDIAWSFRWIGATDDDPRLVDALADRALLGAADLVRFIPPTPELRRALGAADAFVLPSREDAFPLAAVEAALAGLPLLCFASGGIGDLVEPDGGALVAFPDLDAMARVLIRWHDHPDERTAAGAAVRDRARRDHDAVDHARAFDAAVLHDLRPGQPTGAA